MGREHMSHLLNEMFTYLFDTSRTVLWSVDMVNGSYLVTTPRIHRRRVSSLGVIHSAVESCMPQRRQARSTLAPDAAPKAIRLIVSSRRVNGVRILGVCLGGDGFSGEQSLVLQRSSQRS